MDFVQSRKLRRGGHCLLGLQRETNAIHLSGGDADASASLHRTLGVSFITGRMSRHRATNRSPWKRQERRQHHNEESDYSSPKNDNDNKEGECAEAKLRKELEQTKAAQDTAAGTHHEEAKH